MRYSYDRTAAGYVEYDRVIKVRTELRKRADEARQKASREKNAEKKAAWKGAAMAYDDSANHMGAELEKR